MTALSLSSQLKQRLQQRAQQTGQSVEALLSTLLDQEVSTQNDDPQLITPFFELSIDLYCILTADGYIQRANPAFENMMPSSSAGSNFVDYVHHEDQETVVAAFAAFQKGHRAISFSCRLRHVDNVARWYLWTIYPQQPSLIHAVGRDITPFREMEAKEHERNIFAEALLDTVLAINSSLALEQVMERILSNVGAVVSYDHVNLMLVEGDEAEIVGSKSSERLTTKHDNLVHSRFSVSADEHLSYMYETQDSVILSKITTPPPWMVTAPTTQPAAFLGTPIIVEDHVIGFIGLFNFDQEFFTPLHAQQLLTFANQAGIAIQNAQLYEEAQAAAILKERQRMAQELHDSVNQNLFAASTYADLLPRVIDKKPAQIPKYATEISRLIRGAVAQMRMILIELHPDKLINTEIVTIIKQLCDAFSSHTDIAVHFESHGNGILDKETQIALYRVTQEALHNIDKHADADTVWVKIELQLPAFSLRVEDDGNGFNPDAIGDMQFGIQGMYARAMDVRAELTVNSRPQNGTKIHFFRKEVRNER